MGKEKTRIKSRDELKSVLKMSGVPVDDWDSFKGLNDLWEEVQSGETLLLQRNKEIIRQVSFVRVFIFYKDGRRKFQLIETKQVRNDGSTRERGFDFIAEKFKTSEKPKEAARRGIREELGISAPRRLSRKRGFTETRESPSYPGLKSEYKVYLFKTTLNSSQYNPNGYTENDGKKTTYFEWKEI